MLSTDTTTFYLPDYTQNQRWLRAVARQGYIVATITMEGHWNDSGEYRMHTRVSNEKPRATRLGSRQLVVAEQILAELMVKVLAALTAAGWYEHIGSYRHFTEWEAPWSTNTADRLNERVSSHCAGCGRSLWSEGKNWGKGYWLTSCPACPQAAEVAEQAIEVYARPAEPEPTPVYVAEPAEQPAPAPEQPAQPPCFCPDCGRSLFDAERQIWLTLCPACHQVAEPVRRVRALTGTRCGEIGTVVGFYTHEITKTTVYRVRFADGYETEASYLCWRLVRDPSLICPGCGRETYVIFNKSNCPDCLGV